MTWLPPELEVGEEPELKPPELELDDEPELAELEPEEPEELEPVDPVEPELVPELVPDELEPELAEDEFDEPVEVEEDDALVLCADPGRARASAPAVTTLAMTTVVVVDRTLFLPRSLAAMAWRIPSSRRALLMYLILWSCTRRSLHEPSAEPMSRAALSVVGEPRGSSLSQAEAIQAT